jgi:hypothetical protein
VGNRESPQRGTLLAEYFGEPVELVFSTEPFARFGSRPASASPTKLTPDLRSETMSTVYRGLGP